jgi:hypothetical protein
VPGFLIFFASLSPSPDSWSSSEAARFNPDFEAILVQVLDTKNEAIPPTKGLGKVIFVHELIHLQGLRAFVRHHPETSLRQTLSCRELLAFLGIRYTENVTPVLLGPTQKAVSMPTMVQRSRRTWDLHDSIVFPDLTLHIVAYILLTV